MHWNCRIPRFDGEHASKLRTAATLGASSIIEGSNLAGTAITFGTKAKLHSCALAQSAVTFESKGSVDLPSYAYTPSPPVDQPAPILEASLEDLSFDEVCNGFIIQAGTVLTFGAATIAHGGDVGYGSAIAGSSDFQLGKEPTSGIDSSDFSTKHAALMAEKSRIESLASRIWRSYFHRRKLPFRRRRRNRRWHCGHSGG